MNIQKCKKKLKIVDVAITPAFTTGNEVRDNMLGKKLKILIDEWKNK